MVDEKKSSQSYPKEPKIILKLKAQPEHNNFTRFLSFKNHSGDWKRLEVAFRKTADLTWEATEFPEGIGVLKSFVETGNRNYWDSMFFENRNGKTTLFIESLYIEMQYDDPAGHTPTGMDHGKIPIVDSNIDKILLSEVGLISLDDFARNSRYKWAGINKSSPMIIRKIAEDLGKSGSDGSGQDNYGKNPKYGGAISMLCSEFASWYYYECDIKIGDQNFKNIEATQQMHDAFRVQKRLYYFNNHDQCWRNVDEPHQVYHPKAGDYFERRGPGGAEHSMILLRWDDNASKKEAIVFNGPWPVTLRRVTVGNDERETDLSYFIGSISY